ncbi:hypothetical protein ACFVXD_45060, partial [Kitasatospora herbaricolor]
MNPSELTLLVLRFGFLLLLWAFVFGIVYALRTDLFGQRVRKLPEPQAAAAPSPFPAAPTSGATAPTMQPPPVSTLPSGANTASDRPKATLVSATR